MSADVIELHPRDVGDGFVVDVNNVLECAKGKLSQTVVVGIDADGELYVAGSHGAETTHFLLHRAAAFILDHDVVR